MMNDRIPEMADLQVQLMTCLPTVVSISFAGRSSPRIAGYYRLRLYRLKEKSKSSRSIIPNTLRMHEGALQISEM